MKARINPDGTGSIEWANYTDDLGGRHTLSDDPVQARKEVEKIDQRAVEAGRFKGYRAKQRVRALKGVKAKREDNTRTDKALSERVLTVRARYPRWGTRKVAAHILEADDKIPRVAERECRHPEHQAAIEALHQRIYRLLKS